MHSSPLEEAAKGWNTPKYNLHRWPSLEVHHWATILRFLTTIWFLQFSIGSRQKKGKEIFLWEFQTFYPGMIAQIFEKNICYLKSPISSWTGPQSKLLFWAFAKNPTTQWISFGVILVILVMGVILGHESIVERLAFFLLGLTQTSRIDRWAILFDPLGSCCTRLLKHCQRHYRPRRWLL